MALTKKWIDNWRSKALAKLDWEFWGDKREFGEEVARKVLGQKLTKINEMYNLRIQSLS